MKASSEDLLVKTITVKANKNFNDFASEVSLVKDGKAIATLTDLENT
jgi:hypothetical protein